jgi:hypothetical protein
LFPGGPSRQCGANCKRQLIYERAGASAAKVSVECVALLRIVQFSNDCLTDDAVFVQMQTLFSRHNTNAIQCLAAASHPSSDHGFCDGAQHQRQDRFRESPFDTAIFILQNKTAAKTWPASESIRMELLKAMAQGKPSAAGAEVLLTFR